MTDQPLQVDPFLRQLTAARPPVAPQDLSATGERATAILTRVLAATTPTPAPSRAWPLRSALRGALRRPSRAMLALGFPVAGLAALVVVAVGVLSGSGSIGPQPAAGAVLRGAAAALDQKPGTILLERYNVTSVGRDGKSSSWQQEQISETPAGPGPQTTLYYSNAPGQHAEQARIGGNQEVYLKATNTVYINSIWGDRITPGKKPGTYTYTAPNDGPGAATHPAPPLTLTARQARALRDGSNEVAETAVGRHIPFHVKLAVVPATHFPSDIASIRHLLRTHKLTVDGLTTVDGRQAIKLTSVTFKAARPDQVTDSGLEFYVDPRTYRPIKEVFSRPPFVQNSQTFTEYQTLSINAANERLLSLTARHPDARVDRNPADYRRAAGLRSASG